MNRRLFLLAGATTVAWPLFARVLRDAAPHDIEAAVATMGDLTDAFSSNVRVVGAGRFVEGRAAVDALGGTQLREQPASMRTLGGQASADGSHAYTLGHITGPAADGPLTKRKYLAYWVRGADGWRIALFKRGGTAADPGEAIEMPRLHPPGEKAHPAELIAREAEFSRAAADIGLQPAFRAFGSDRAVNLGSGPSFAIGAEAISREVAGNGPPPQLAWSADGALVADSNDLGVTWGYIRDLKATAAPDRFAYFTVWGRERGAWHYVAE